MIKVEHIEVFGFEAAIRGMRNPMNSWDLSDSRIRQSIIDEQNVFIMGPNDLKLLTGLSKAGTSHRKALRMIHVQMDITAPLYWWKDYDTYKVATVANGCSTMHKIHSREFTIDDFSTDQLDTCGRNLIELTKDSLNHYRQVFIDSGLKDKSAWYSMIQLLPSSYMQKRTVDINYETALALCMDRQLHKLNEFREFVRILLEELPYLKEVKDAVES